MNQATSALPGPWIDRIFQKLSVTFGRDFLGRWGGVPIEEVKADWAHELRGFQQNPEAIKFALQTCLSGKPPTVQDFKALCIRRPVDAAPALPSPPADPERVAAELAKMEQSRRAAAVDHKAWAKRLHQAHEAGQKLNLNQIRCMRNALGLQVPV